MAITKNKEAKLNKVKATFYHYSDDNLSTSAFEFSKDYQGSKSSMITLLKKKLGVTSKLVSVDKDISKVSMEMDDKETNITLSFAKRSPAKTACKKEFNFMVIYEEKDKEHYRPLYITTFPLLDYSDSRIDSVSITVKNSHINKDGFKIIQEALHAAINE